MKRRCVCSIMLATALGVGGCERVARDMYEQPRYDPGEASALFADGKASRTPPPGSVPHSIGEAAATSSGRRGAQRAAELTAAAAASAPPALTAELLLRGRARYGIYCLPCHSAVGDGDGPVVRRGFPSPPSFHEARLRAAPDRHLFDVITHGHGVMASYADRVTPEDRWAIVGYLRALQLSQRAPVEALPAALQARLRAVPAVAASGASAPPAPRKVDQ